MKRNKIVIGIGITIAVLAMSLGAIAANHVALLPASATLSVSGPNHVVTLDAFCNMTPCNITWIVVLSESNVGSITHTTGPQTNFIVGTTPGTAEIIASDGQGHTAHATITVQQ
jgi:hypothetical protein